MSSSFSSCSRTASCRVAADVKRHQQSHSEHMVGIWILKGMQSWPEVASPWTAAEGTKSRQHLSFGSMERFLLLYAHQGFLSDAADIAPAPPVHGCHPLHARLLPWRGGVIACGTKASCMDTKPPELGPPCFASHDEIQVHK